MISDQTFLKELINCHSVTPNDAGCMEIISSYLGIKPRLINRGNTTNAYFEFGKGPLFLFVGHTDVVPPGPLELWDNDPFSLTLKGQHFIGRGIVDMKGAVYAFCTAFKKNQSQLNGKVGILLTSDEEGNGKDGLSYAISKLNIKANWALVGEPTSIEEVGDTFKHERRGSHHFKLTLEGKQGHIAYPHLCHNPADSLTEFLSEFKELKSLFPPNNDLSIYSIKTSTHTGNIIPKSIHLGVNLRYENNELITKCLELFKRYDPNTFDRIGAKPYSSNPIQIKEALQKAIMDVKGIEAMPSKLGGVSDARFLPPIASEIIEFGLRSEYAHQINEKAPIQDLIDLEMIYTKLLLSLLSDDNLSKKDYNYQKDIKT